jgi:hypothetical protein
MLYFRKDGVYILTQLEARIRTACRLKLGEHQVTKTPSRFDPARELQPTTLEKRWSKACICYFEAGNLELTVMGKGYNVWVAENYFSKA